MDTEKYLKYGDRIVLKNKNLGLFLGSRGTESHSGYYIKVPEEAYLDNPYLYPALLDLVFEIHPQLSYGASKEYADLPLDGTNRDITEQRMNLEENLNDTKLKENKGKPVFLDSIIQLYHVATKTYLQVFPQKIAETDMGVIGSTAITNDNAQFKITLPFSFFKRGTPLNYDNSFILQDVLKKTIAFPHSPNTWSKLEMKIKMPERNEGFMGLFRDTNEKHYPLPYIVENQSFFKGYYAGYVNLSDVGADSYGNDFQAVNVNGYFDRSEGVVLWGNAVTIKKMDTTTGRVSMLISEVNRSAVKNSTFYRYIDQIELKKVVSIESNFHIIPLKASLVGSTINYDSNKTVYCLLKCPLSGRFLKEDPLTNQILVTDSYDVEKTFIKNNAATLEKMFKAKQTKYNEGKYTPGEFSTLDIESFQVKSFDLNKSDKDMFTEYLRHITFRLQKMSSDDDQYINNSNFFKIITPSGRALKIAEAKLPADEPKDNKQESFVNFFIPKMRSRYIQEHQVIQSTGQNDFDLFFLHDNSIFLEFGLARIAPFLPNLCKVPTAQLIDTPFLMEFTEVIRIYKILINELVQDKDRPLDLSEIQNLFRQASVIDMIMRLFNQVAELSSGIEVAIRPNALLACIEAIQLLEMLVKDNKVNSLYLFQWKNFINSAILSNETDLFEDTKIDSLFFTIIDILQSYSVYSQDFIEPLCSRIKFEKFDCHKIEILIKILTSFRQSSEDVEKTSVNNIINNILKDSNRNNIFRPLRNDSQNKVYIQSDSEPIFIDEVLVEVSPNKYNYIMSVCKLAALLVEIDLLKVSNQLDEVFGKAPTILLIEDDNLPDEFRCILLKIFSALFLLYPFYHIKLIKFTDKVVVRQDLYVQGTTPGVETKGKRYSFSAGVICANTGGKKLSAAMGLDKASVDEIINTVDSKNTLNKFIQEGQENKAILSSSLKILLQLLDTNFFTEEDIIKWKKEIEGIILAEKAENIGSKGRSPNHDDFHFEGLSRYQNPNKSRRNFFVGGTVDFDKSEQNKDQLQTFTKMVMIEMSRANTFKEDLGEDQSAKSELYEHLDLFLDILLKINERLSIIRLRDMMASKMDNKNIKTEQLEVSQINEIKVRKPRQKEKRGTKEVLNENSIHELHTLKKPSVTDGSDRLGDLIKKLKPEKEEETVKNILQWLSLNIPVVFFKVLEYHLKTSRWNYFLYKTLISYHVIQDIFEQQRYQFYRTSCNHILSAVKSISRDYSYKENSDRTKYEINRVFKALRDRFMDVYIPVDENERQRHLEYSLREQNDTIAEEGIKVQLSPNDEGILVNVLNYFFMRLDHIANHQLLILKSGFLSLIIQVLVFFNKVVTLDNSQWDTHNFRELGIFEETMFKDKSKSCFNQLNLTILMLIYYSVYNNKTVVNELRNDPSGIGKKLQDSLLNNLASEELIFKKVSLMILIHVFGANFDSVYSLSKRNRYALSQVVSLYDKEVKKSKDMKGRNYEILINYLELFKRSASLHNLCFEKNYQIIHEVIEGTDKVHRSTSSNLARLIDEEAKSSLDELFKKGDIKTVTQKKDFKKIRLAANENRSADISPRLTAASPSNAGSQPLGIPAANRLELIDDVDEYDSSFNIANLPGIIVYTNQLLKFFAHIGHLATPDLKVKIRKLVSMDSILSLFNASKQLWFFKITILKFLEVIFMHQKLDLKGKGQIFSFIQNSLLADVRDYFRSKHFNKYTSLIFTMSNITLIDNLLLKRESEIRSCYNYICYESHDAQFYYVRSSIIEFIKHFSLICHQDKNATMLDNLIGIIEDQKVYTPVDLAFASVNERINHNEGTPEKFTYKTMSENKRSTLNPNATNKDGIDNKIEAIKNKLAQLFKDDPQRQNLYEKMVESESKDQFLIETLTSKDAEHFDPEHSNAMKKQYLNDFKKFNVSLRSVLSKNQNGFYEVFLAECCRLLGSTKTQSESVILLCRYLLQQYTLSQDDQMYFVNTLLKNRFVPNLLDAFVNHEKDKDAVKKLLTLLKTLLESGSTALQANLYEELSRDIDNKFPSIVSLYLGQAIANFEELEALSVQMASIASPIVDHKELLTAQIQAKTDKQINEICMIYEMLRLMCEGHFLSLQNYLRVQTMGNNLLKPYQINFIDKTISFFKSYIKVVKEENNLIAVTVLRFFIELLQGPCRENQLEVIKKKFLEPLEDFHCNLIYFNLQKDTIIELTNLILTLKLALIESTKEKIIIKTLAYSLNLRYVWLRIKSIYCDLNDLQDINPQQMVEYDIRASSMASKLHHYGEFNSNIGDHYDNKETHSTKTKKKDIHSSYSINMVEALNSLILLEQLSNFGPDTKEIIDKSYEAVYEKNRIIAKARKFFNDKIQSIEFVDEEQNLQTLYFYIHPKTEFLSKISIHKFEESVDRRNWTTKANDLMKFVSRAYMEIKHNYTMHSKLGVHISVSYFYFFKLLNFVIAIVVNLIDMLEPSMSDEVNDDSVFHSWHRSSAVERSAFILSLVMLFNYVIAFSLYVIYEFVVKIKIFLLEEEELEATQSALHGGAIQEHSAFFKKSARIGYKIMFETKILLVSGLLISCILGLTQSKLYFSFLLLDIVEISPILLNVIRSVTLNFAALSTTWLFIIIMCFIYSSIAFYNDSIRNNLNLLDQPELLNCGTYPTCFWNTVLYGIKSGGGLGEVMQIPDYRQNRSAYIYRSFFDIIFYVTMILILMNIILGIIIDSFAELRDMRNHIENDMNNVCFICNITKQEFNNNRISYSKHTRLVHDMWNYVFYIVGLLEKNPNEYTGIESYIAQKYHNKELDWLPFQQTALLKKRTISEEEARDIKINRIEELLIQLIEGKTVKKVPEE
jgi:hypothetical protein